MFKQLLFVSLLLFAVSSATAVVYTPSNIPGYCLPTHPDFAFTHKAWLSAVTPTNPDGTFSIGWWGWWSVYGPQQGTGTALDGQFSNDTSYNLATDWIVYQPVPAATYASYQIVYYSPYECAFVTLQADPRSSYAGIMYPPDGHPDSWVITKSLATIDVHHDHNNVPVDRPQYAATWADPVPFLYPFAGKTARSYGLGGNSIITVVDSVNPDDFFMSFQWQVTVTGQIRFFNSNYQGATPGAFPGVEMSYANIQLMPDSAINCLQSYIDGTIDCTQQDPLATMVGIPYAPVCMCAW
jgi:hypothetical protein